MQIDQLFGISLTVLASGVDSSLRSDRSRKSAGRHVLREYGERYAVVLAIVVLVVVFTFVVPGGHFLTSANFVQMAATVPAAMIVALGLTITLAAGDFDLSVGPALGVSAATLVALNVKVGLPLGVCLAAVVVLALVIGVVNAVLVVGFGLNALIATLATGTVMSGATSAILHNETVPGVAQGLQSAMLSTVFGIPTPFVAVIVIAAILWYVHEQTPLGRQVTMTGEGRDAARLTGVPIDRIRAGAFVAASVLSAGGAVILVGQIGAADPATGPDYVLPAFAAAFLGATTIRVGRFNPWGTVVAICLVQVGVTGLQQLGLESWVVQVFQGGMLLVAIGFARLAAVAKGRAAATWVDDSDADEPPPSLASASGNAEAQIQRRADT